MAPARESRALGAITPVQRGLTDEPIRQPADSTARIAHTPATAQTKCACCGSPLTPPFVLNGTLSWCFTDLGGEK